MGEIIPIVSQAAAEDAWEVYGAHMVKAVSNPRLMVDRAHREEERRLYRRWTRLFDRMDG